MENANVAATAPASQGRKTIPRSIQWLCATVLVLGAVGVGTTTWRNSGSEAPRNVRRQLTETSVKGVPFFFGAGQGTTGTHTMYEATCRLNVTSVHGDLGCVDKSSGRSEQRARDGIEAHTQSNSAYLKLRSCAHIGQNPKCSFADTVFYIGEMKRWAREVILSGVNAVHDSPYIFMTQFVIETATAERDMMPILLLSERNPKKWSARRSRAHPMTVVCRDSLGLSEDNTEHTLHYDPFDLEQCLQRAITRQREYGLPPYETFNEIFASYGTLMRETNGNPHAVEVIRLRSQVALQRYQTRLMRRVYEADYTIDMFDRRDHAPADESTIANEIEKALIRQNRPGRMEALRRNGFGVRALKIESEHLVTPRIT